MKRAGGSTATRLAVVTVVVTTILGAAVLGAGVAGASETGSQSQVVPQQVDIAVTDFGGDIAFGGRVGGVPGNVTGQVGAAGQFNANAILSIGRMNLTASTAFDASVQGDANDVLGTTVGDWQFNASLGVFDRKLTAFWNGTVPTGQPVAPATVFATDVGSANAQQVVRWTLPPSVWTPAQTGGGGWFDVSFWELYGFMVNLLLGLILVGLFPAFSRRVADEVTHDALRTGIVGLAVMVVTPLLLLLLVLSLFGFPLALVGGGLFLLASWVGAIYGRFAVGVWLLDVIPRGLSAVGVEQSPIENRWAALFLGLILVGLAIRIPYLGRVVDGVVVALGLGALVRIFLRTYRETERSIPLVGRSTGTADTVTTDDG
ncbi:hypothetical protein [Haloarchaeobius sp. HRN-SO-5]|uniref:hypothetical protein n=1 Tax=Haloarchaeobius sp. HRN-SO-5 TaxID=3446118 RepID=UPI003EB71DC1